MVVARGEVLVGGRRPDEKGRPFLVVNRDAANEVMQRVLVALVTRRIRGLPSELALGVDEGLPVGVGRVYCLRVASAAVR